MTKPLTPKRIERQYRIQTVVAWCFIGFSALYAPVGPILLLAGGTGLTLWLTPVFAALWIVTAVLWLKTAKTSREMQYDTLEFTERARRLGAQIRAEDEAATRS